MHVILLGAGPYTIPGGAEALAFIKSKYALALDDDYPDVELVLGAGALNGDVFGSFRNILGIPDSVFQKMYLPHVGKPAFGIAAVLLQPKSRGRVTLKDSNPLHWPVIRPNYYSEEEDLNTMVEAVKMVRYTCLWFPFFQIFPISNHITEAYINLVSYILSSNLLWQLWARWGVMMAYLSGTENK